MKTAVGTNALECFATGTARTVEGRGRRCPQWEAPWLLQMASRFFRPPACRHRSIADLESVDSDLKVDSKKGLLPYVILYT